MIGVVTGDWHAAAAAALDADAVLVVPHPDLDPQRLPRTEVAATGETLPDTGRGGAARQRRPHPV